MAAPSTKPLVAISDIRDDVVVLNNGSLRMVLEISAINFELRSEDEQAAILQGFQSFLNSVDFPVQIVVDSRKFEIDAYLRSLEQRTQSIANELLRVQVTEYTTFVRELSSLANIMSKKFYITVPFYVVESPGGRGILDRVASLFGRKRSMATIDQEKFIIYRNQLAQRVELVFDGLVGLGLRARIVPSDELKKLFYAFYNPGIHAAATNF
jgi:hypothetical protein